MFLSPTSAITPGQRQRQRQRQYMYYCAGPGGSPRLGSHTPRNGKLRTETESFSKPDAHCPAASWRARQLTRLTCPQRPQPPHAPAQSASRPGLPVPSLRAGALVWWRGWLVPHHC